METNGLKSEKDPMGRAIFDYVKRQALGNDVHVTTDKLRVFSPMFEEDEIPLETLFRQFDDMPLIERAALGLVKGKTLDVGAGSGCHSLVLQNRGVDVTAIDISPLAVEAMKLRGVKNVVEQDFFAHEGRYDTILMLMNGIGIVGSLERLSDFFRHVDHILSPGGQLLCDSSDISYVFEDENGKIDYPDTGHYFGELNYTMQYKETTGEPFAWLYVDAGTLRQEAGKSGFDVEIIVEGEHYDYLARISKRDG
ncbi:MAG: methyltransferase domain-containing protein [Prevotella sp.]|nr:methyltransferase domain-containing protein [Prevotella sp.]